MKIFESAILLVFILFNTSYLIAQNNVEFAVKVFLQGSYDTSTGLMDDGLRLNDLIPAVEPYSTLEGIDLLGENYEIKYTHVGGGNETIPNPTSIFADYGANSIVDWLFFSLRDANAPEIVVATRSVLLQRDGDVVDIDGISPVLFSIANGNYYIQINHRNHLGVMSAVPIAVENGVLTIFDFTSMLNDNFTYTDIARTTAYPQYVYASLNVKALWAGDANADGVLVAQGARNDKDKVFDVVIGDPGNSGNMPDYNFVVYGYHTSDTNMDGQIKYQGIQEDTFYPFLNTFGHIENINTNSLETDGRSAIKIIYSQSY